MNCDIYAEALSKSGMNRIFLTPLRGVKRSLWRDWQTGALSRVSNNITDVYIIVPIIVIYSKLVNDSVL